MICKGLTASTSVHEVCHLVAKGVAKWSPLSLSLVKSSARHLFSPSLLMSSESRLKTLCSKVVCISKDYHKPLTKWWYISSWLQLRLQSYFIISAVLYSQLISVLMILFYCIITNNFKNKWLLISYCESKWSHVFFLFQFSELMLVLNRMLGNIKKERLIKMISEVPDEEALELRRLLHHSNL